MKEPRRKWREANRQRSKELSRRWHDNNKGRRAASAAKRRANQRQACVPWADDKVIESYYAAARALTLLTGFKWHVDHVIPLQGKNVCGLHHQDNLRVVPWDDNIKKQNKFSMEDHELRLA